MTHSQRRTTIDSRTEPLPGGVFVCLPVLNEEANIVELLQRLDDALGGDYVVCVIDDGSRDRTRELVIEQAKETTGLVTLLERTKTQRGSQRGGALHVGMIWGLENTDCDVFVELDGDLSHRPEELPAAVTVVRSGDADVVVASKFVAGSTVVNRPLGRRLVSRICSAAVHVFLSRRVSDYSNGLRIYSRAAAALIEAARIRYTSPIYLSEVLAIWLRAGLRVREVPTMYIGRNEGLSKLRLIDLAKAAVAVIEIASRFHVLGFKPAADVAETRSARSVAVRDTS
jgi:dolichol-phosphate mannosyltransferase